MEAFAPRKHVSEWKHGYAQNVSQPAVKVSKKPEPRSHQSSHCQNECHARIVAARKKWQTHATKIAFDHSILKATHIAIFALSLKVYTKTNTKSDQDVFHRATTSGAFGCLHGLGPEQRRRNRPQHQKALVPSHAPRTNPQLRNRLDRLRKMQRLTYQVFARRVATSYSERTSNLAGSKTCCSGGVAAQR
jgi:hypothetical protein